MAEEEVREGATQDHDEAETSHDAPQSDSEQAGEGEESAPDAA